MKILIGIDESTHSKAAVEFVRQMTWPKNTQVVFVTAVEPAVLAYTEVYVPTLAPAHAQEELTRVRKEMMSNAALSLRDMGIGSEFRVLQGDPRIVLVEAARVEGADLIVVGSHGRTGIAKLIMGSVASHVVTHAPCSVLVVKL